MSLPPVHDTIAELQEVIARLTKIASQVPGVVYQYKLRADGTSCFPYASEGIRGIYRVEPEAVRDDASVVFEVLHPDDLPSVAAAISKSAETLQPWQQEYRVRFANGDVRWLYGNAVPEAQADGSVLWHGFITDITDRKQEEAAKQYLENQLRQAQKLEGIGRLAGGVAHDFNNLLTSILGFADLALASVPPDSAASGYLQRIQQTAEQGATMTQQLLASARKKVIKPRITSLNNVLTSLSPMLQRLLDADIELQLQLTPSISNVLVDPGGLEQVIINLIVNARQAMPEGGVLAIATCMTTCSAGVTLHHSEMPPGDYVQLTVSDTGCGMAAETLAQIFEPFFTTKSVGEGSGLGLAICDGIIRQANGYITVETSLGQGASFHIFLPPTELTESAPMREDDVQTPVLQHGGETVLVVEDEASIRDLARMFLQRKGYRVLTAGHGGEALDVIRNSPATIDLVLTDLVMPKMGGKELAAKLRVQYPHIRILFTCGYAENGIFNSGALDPSVHFLPKPYTSGQLMQKVRQTLDEVV